MDAFKMPEVTIKIDGQPILPGWELEVCKAVVALHNAQNRFLRIANQATYESPY